MAATTEEFLRLSNVEAYYGESHILHGVDLTVKRGEVVTLLGRNGAEFYYGGGLAWVREVHAERDVVHRAQIQRINRRRLQMPFGSVIRCFQACTK